MSKATRLRACPGARRRIDAQECGAHRITRYHCPADCPFNPFSPAQYDRFMEIEAGVIRKSSDWFLDSSPNRAQTLRQLERVGSQGELERLAFQVAEFYYRRDPQGRTCVERWAAAGFPQLNHDEQVIARATLQLRLRLIEVHRVLDDRRTEVVDLLEPAPSAFLICDRALAAQACRFTTLLGWFFPLPHYWRSLGFLVPVPAFGRCDPQEVVAEVVRHLGGPADRAAWAEWFSVNLPRFAAALEAVALARREHMLAELDAEFGEATYELQAPFAACRAALDAIPAVAADGLDESERLEGFAESRVWFDESPEVLPASELAQPVLGHVLLGQAQWRLVALGAQRLARLRERFERALGDRVRFCSERRDDLRSRLKSRRPPYDPALVPPRLLEEPSKLALAFSRSASTVCAAGQAAFVAQVMAEADRAWLDESVPALDGQTPRQAAQDPALRPRLIRLLKERVRAVDEQNLETGGSYDINWLLAELGLHEILFDPPPFRPPTRHADDEGSDAEPWAPRDGLAPWPALPARPFTKRQAVKRMLAGLEHFETVDQAMEAMAAAGGFLPEDVRLVTGDLLSAEEYDFLDGYLAQVWFAFVPPGCYGPNLEPEELHTAIGSQLERLQTAVKAGKEQTARFLLKQGPQPALMQALAESVAASWEDFLASHRKRSENFVLMLVILRAVVDLLDARCRADQP